ncbi:GumC family protein [Nodosilinea sp. PGN35]|uniref:GumC family protein n=1 Tax=Nodosilinea sp. PGN35 TaxID=3020489 RepID=UPI0023B26C19|nr:polysaccharide biosynthesis tyrosine autokinase [Nodosilinea sp. TSF1-S3]MDF0367031.1 polysaccharide biosynthesis tyrosine autokinase [Nodosilinea sp. TSF1-S3]
MGQPPLLTMLLASLRRYWPVGVIALASTLGASLLYLLLVPPKYLSSVRIMVDEKNTSISALGQALAELSTNTPIGVNPLATQAELIASEEVLNQALTAITYSQNLSASELPALKQLRRGLSVKILPATNILELTYTHTDPQFAVQMLDAIARSTVDKNTAAIRLEATTVRQFLEGKIPQEEARLAQAEEAERQFRQQNGIISLETQTQTMLDRLSVLEAESVSLQADLRDTQEQQRLLDDVTGASGLEQAYVTLQAGQSSTLQDLTQRLDELEAQIAEARSRLGDQHPDLLALYDQRDEMAARYTDTLAQLGGSPERTDEAKSTVGQDLLSQYIAGQIRQAALTERLGVVQQERQRLSQMVLVLPERQQALAGLVRRRSEAEQTLRLLQDKLEEARLAEAQLVSNIRTLGVPSRPDRPASPNAKVVLVLGTVMGLVLAGGAIALLDLLDDRIHPTTNLEDLLQLPVLGDLPALPPQLLTAGRLRDFLADDERVEPYRRLANVLGHACRQGRLDGARSGYAVVFSSVGSGDGKAAVAIYLAVTAALLSRRSLLLDADLRRSAPTQFFGAAHLPGFAEVIGAEAVGAGLGSLGDPAEAVVQPTGVTHCDLLPSGQVQGNPAALVESPAVEGLLESLRPSYDWILIDAPTVVDSADATALAQYADSLVLAVRPGHTRRSELLQAVADLRRSGTPILGVVLNRTPLPEEIFSDLLHQAQDPSLGLGPRTVGYAHVSSAR